MFEVAPQLLPREDPDGAAVLKKVLDKELRIEFNAKFVNIEYTPPPPQTGETLAFLSRGKVQAPIHWVPVSNGVEGRCSAPFFLRSSPNAVLNEEMTTREFCEQHAVGPRPWRYKKLGTRTDW